MAKAAGTFSDANPDGEITSVAEAPRPGAAAIDATPSSSLADQTGGAAETPSRPEWAQADEFKNVPDKFIGANAAETIAKLATSYNELEKGGKGKKASGGIPQIGAGGDGEPQMKSLIERAGLDPAAVMDEFNTTRDFSPETRAAFAQQGISSLDLDVYRDGLASRQDRAVSDMRDAAGGEEQLNALMKWAGILSDADKTKFQARINNPELSVGAVLELARMRAKATGFGGDAMIPGDGGSVDLSDNDGYETLQDYNQALADFERASDMGQADKANAIKAKIGKTNTDDFY